MSPVATPRKRKPTEREILAANANRFPWPWNECVAHECATSKRYSSIRVALAVQAAIQLQRDVAAAEEYARAIRKGPRGRRSINPN
jgi:hypothetical protein